MIIPIITKATKKDSREYIKGYEKVENILTLLKRISKEEKVVIEETESQPIFSAADEIRKYKELLDMGAITQEEYEIKKNELLKL